MSKVLYYRIHQKAILSDCFLGPSYPDLIFSKPKLFFGLFFRGECTGAHKFPVKQKNNFGVLFHYKNCWFFLNYRRRNATSAYDVTAVQSLSHPNVVGETAYRKCGSTYSPKTKELLEPYSKSLLCGASTVMVALLRSVALSS